MVFSVATEVKFKEADMTLITNNLVNFFKAQNYELVYKIIEKIGMKEKPCLTDLWGELMHEN